MKKEIEQFDLLNPPVPYKTHAHKNNEFFRHALAKGKYDINYMITFCRILIDHIDKYKMTPRDLPFSLNQSLKRLVASLEVERDQMQ